MDWDNFEKITRRILVGFWLVMIAVLCIGMIFGADENATFRYIVSTVGDIAGPISVATIIALFVGKQIVLRRRRHK